MNAPFTINSTNWRQIEKLEELRLAYSERNRFLYGSWQRYIWEDGYYNWTPGDGTASDTLQNNQPAHGKGFNAQCDYFFVMIQNFFEFSVCDSGDAFLVDNYQNFDGVSYEAFCQRAGGGLYESSSDYGFRRVTEVDESGAPVFQRGWAEVGDILGPWLIDDLLSAFSVPLVYKPKGSTKVHTIERTTRTKSLPYLLNDDIDGKTDEEIYTIYYDAVSAEELQENQSEPNNYPETLGSVWNTYDYAPYFRYFFAYFGLFTISTKLTLNVPADVSSFFVQCVGLFETTVQEPIEAADLDRPVGNGWSVFTSIESDNPDLPPNRGLAPDRPTSGNGYRITKAANFNLLAVRVFFNTTNR